MKALKALTAIAIALAVCQPAFAQQPTLSIGQPAPELKVGKWLKGTPQTKFEKGKIYVVEFWATWCGPCIESIPHVTELAKKYKDVTFCGVSVWEQPTTTTAEIQKFVDNMGDKMGYNVAIDADKHMAEKWMTAAGEDGIPSAFVIDKDGTIAWIGHPMEMDEPLAAIVAGKFDKKAYAAEKAKAQKEMAELNEAMAPISELLMQGDNKGAQAELGKVLEKNPKFEKYVGMFMLQLMMRNDDAKAGAYGQKLADGLFKEDANSLNSIAWMIVDPEIPATKRDVKAAVKISERSNSLSGNKNPMFLDTLALAYFLDGQVKKAVETQEKAVSLLDDSVPAETVSEMKARLAEFKKKLG